MVQNFVSLVFRHGLIPIVNKPARVTRNIDSAADHMITNSVIRAELTFQLNSYINKISQIIR